MRRAIFALLATTAVASSTGCCCWDRLFCHPFGCCGYGCGSDCENCTGGCDDGGGGGPMYGGGGGCSSCGMASHGQMGQGMMAHHGQADAQVAQGPPSGTVTYPYYTNRGPRDFLARNPRNIGP